MWNPFARHGTVGSAAPGAQHDAAESYPAAVDGATLASAAVAEPLPEIAQVETMGEVNIVTLLVDELSFHRGAPELADLLEELVDHGRNRIVLDIQNVRFMDSACIGCIV